ncbi:putative disease resistance protein [Trifolium repens]|nr:putative disease resistance protein [Trifolium repens]
MEGFLTYLGKTYAEKLINGVIEKSRYLFCFKCIAKEFELEKDNLEAERQTMRQRFGVAIEKDKDIQFNAQFWEEQAEKLIQEDTKTNQRWIPNSDHRKGCKVLVTTRYRWVCDKMSCGITIQLELLSEEDAWDMFQRHADLSVNSSKGLLKQGRKIAKECKGLPVAIATIASSLRGKKGQAEWDVALKSLQNPMSVGGVEDDLVYIYKCLKFSYDNLTDKKAKELFLLCSVFHEDEEISTEILTRLGIGVSLFGEGYDKYNDARNLVVVAKNKLLDSCLLLKTNKGDVKMHDLIREVAQWISNKEILVVDSSNKNQMSSVVGKGNIKYLLFEGNSMDLCSSSGFDGSKLEILIFIVHKGCFVDSFLEKIAGLRVLNLIAGKDEYSGVTLSLPQSIQSLTNIRSLLIKRVKLGNISVLGSLQSLETLDLESCQIEELPQEIAEMKRLRLLNLENCCIYYNNPFEVIQRCPSLEELYFWNSFNPSQEIIITLPPALERYQLIEGLVIMDDFSLSKCVSLQQDYFSEATFKHVMQTAEHLNLQSIKKGWRNLMPEIVPIDQGMNDLIELHLQHYSKLQCLVGTEHIGSQVPNVFSKLVVLKLSSNYHLKELFNGPISSDSLNNLEELYITWCDDFRSLFKYSLKLCNLKTVTLVYCPKLVSVFDLSTSQSLPLLESLEISDCEQLENIFTDDGDNDNNKSCNSLFPKLKIVYIWKCPQLQFILPLFSAKDLLLLETIQISDCDNLKHIFGQHQNVELAFLKELQLKYVRNFIDIFPESSHSFKVEGSSPSIYKPQTELEVEEPIKSNKFPWSHVCCYGYKYKLGGSSSSSSTSNKIPIPSVHEDQPQHCSISLESYCLLRLSHVMCNIKVIELSAISRIKSVCTLSVAQKMSSLESLTIWDCDELNYIVVDIGDGCEKLEYIFGHINASDHHRQNHLHLPALISLKFSGLPSLIGMGTKNYHTILLSHLEVISLSGCPQVADQSIVDFVYRMSKSQDTTTIKDLSGNDLEAHLASEDLKVQEINLGLQSIDLFGMARMTCLFLVDLIISECDELKYIFEEDNDENKEISNVFPKLRTLVVRKCNKLKYVFPASMCADLTELLFLMLQEAANLEKIFGGSEENDQKIGIPNLLIIVFFDLPRFFTGIQFQTVQLRLVEYCQKLSLTSTYTDLSLTLWETCDEHRLDHDLVAYLCDVNTQLEERSKTKDTSGGNLNGTEIQSSTSKNENAIESNLDSQCLKEKEDQSIEEGSTSETRNDPPMQLVDDLKQKDLMNEQSMGEQCLMKPQQSVAEIDKPSQENNGIKLSVEDGITSANLSGPSATSSLEYGDGQTVAASPPIAITKPLTTQDVDVNNRNKTTSKTNDDQVSLNDDAIMKVSSTIEHQTPSVQLKEDPSQIDKKAEDGDDQIAMTSFSNATTETNNQVSPNDDALKKVSSNVKDQFPKNNEEIISKSLSKGDPSQKVEDISSSFLVTRELEQLVSKKHLDYENLALLNDFLVKHPSVLLRDASLSNKYKGYAYNCLAELLKFLKTHSVLEVLGSCQTEFVELLQDARSFAFDKDWFDGIERRTLYPDLQVPQDALKKLSVSKKQVSKDVEMLRLKIEDLKHQLSSSEAVLENIIQQEAALSAPIGY